jgi:hypothetical protein
MANKDVPHGFKPWDAVKRARLYAVATAPTVNISVGDLVAADTSGIVSPKLGLGMLPYDAAVIPTTPGDAYSIIGAVLECFDEDMNPIDTNTPSGYIAAARAGDGTVAGYILVADHPDQQFEAQADGAFTAGDLDLNYEITQVALNAPDSKTGLSTQEIAISGANVTSTIPLRMYSQAYPQEDVYSAAGCRMICQINPLCHLYGTGTTI